MMDEMTSKVHQDCPEGSFKRVFWDQQLQAFKAKDTRQIRGLLSNLEFPYAHFATRGITADCLYPIVWEAVQHLEYCGFNVMAFCCDGASPNRKFHNMHRTSTSLVYKTPNPFCEDREIFFICDVPHLMKTTRNCWFNSFANKESRALWLSFIMIIHLYKSNTIFI